RAHTEWYNDRVFSYVRWKEGERLFSYLRLKESERLIIVTNFDAEERYAFDLQLPGDIIETWNIQDGTYTLMDVLSNRTLELSVKEGKAETRIDIEPLESLILNLQ
ncbi:MAG: hypothetical protein KAT15_05965, partial [Bacteroidales bacterium]|nr:hypothetical protein [Bacteroidales bacterium]